MANLSVVWGCDKKKLNVKFAGTMNCAYIPV